MRFATGLVTIVGNRVIAAPAVCAANRSTAARTLGTRNASWTNQVSRTSPRRDSSATRIGGCRGAGGGRGAGGRGALSAPAGTQYSQSGGAGGQSGGALHPGGGTQPGGGSGHPGGGRHTKPGTPIRTSYGPASSRVTRAILGATVFRASVVCRGGWRSGAERRWLMDSPAEAEFTEFMHARWPRLVRLGYGLTGDPGLAEDLAQTALARAFASWPRVRRAGDPDAYVRRIMVNANISRFRKRRVREQVMDLPLETLPHPVDDTRQHDDRSALMAALTSLPQGQRAVVVLRYWMDMTEAEVAATLGCSVGNVKSQASRALAKLRLSSDLAEGKLP